ncbi:MAG: di-heme oxidoredictase family protein [Acidobacteriota bacterium]
MKTTGSVAAQNASHSAKTSIGDHPVMEEHVRQSDIENKSIKLKKLLEIGEYMFVAPWNKLDGQGRPASTGNGVPNKRDISNDKGFQRVSGPDATSCADCHNQPFIGGAGGFVANVFVLAQLRDPVTDSVSAEFSNERNTLGMNGSGAIEMLAREMTADLQNIRQAALNEARNTGKQIVRRLDTKGVNFGQITANPDNSVNYLEIEGIDEDLIIKPFHQKGVVNSLRVFTVNAFNHHHGLQAVERFSPGQRDFHGNIIATEDYDEDGVANELTVGDITAATLFQAAMNMPGRVLADDPARRAAAARGEARFAEIGCTDCHKPALVLNSPVYTEPNPYNPIGNLRLQDVSVVCSIDLTRDIDKPRLERAESGSAIVRAFTDLKRHVICDDQDPFYCNEKVVQAYVPTNQFLTRKLWDVGNSAPYGHRGDLTTITESIVHHAGEARPHRERFVALPKEQQAEIVEFLKQLQVLPNGSPREVSESQLQQMLRKARKVKGSGD